MEGKRMQVGIERRNSASPQSRPIEIVERKGIGHPDTMCDALAERFSVALSCYYLQRCGRILHHNVDKGHCQVNAKNCTSVQ
jgi:S-adenosylmethionine synthetase